MAWYNTDWTYRQRFRIDATLVDAVVSAVPVYTSIFDEHFFSRAKAGGVDVRVTEADGETEVARCIMSHDATIGEGCIFVDVSGSISTSSDTYFYVYYGNTAASDYAASATYGADNVWYDYAGVYFPGVSLLDYTNQASGRALTAEGSPGTTAWLEGIPAATYNGTSQYHYYSGTQAVSGYPLTLEALGYSNDNTNSGAWFGLHNSANFTTYSHLIQSASASNLIYKYDSGSASAYHSPVAPASWRYLAGSRDTQTSGTSRLYFDGATSSTSTTDAQAISVNRIAIGVAARAVPQAYFPGSVTAAYLSDSVRSAGYVSTMNSAWSNAGFRIAGPDIETEVGIVTPLVEFTVANGSTSGSTGSGGSNVVWTNVSSALTNIATAATCDIPQGRRSYQMRLTNVNGALDAIIGQPVLGIEIEAYGTGEDRPGDQYLTTALARLIVGGSLVGEDKGHPGFGVGWNDNALDSEFFGDIDDLWNLTPTGAEIAADDFGIALQFQNSDRDNATIAINLVGVRVHYGVAQAPVDTGGFFLAYVA